MRYPIVIHKAPSSDYGLTIPDLPGCFSAGSTIEEAINVEVDISKLSLKSKRINITMPERRIRTVDQYAKRYGSTISGLLSQAITEYMATHQ